MKTHLKKQSHNEPVGIVFSSLYKLFSNNIREILWIEKQLSSELLPKISGTIASPNLCSLINGYKNNSKLHAEKLVKVLKASKMSARGKKTLGAAFLITEYTAILENTQYGPVRDAAIIFSSQKLLHLQIAAYRTLQNLGRSLGEDAVAEQFQTALVEINKIDNLLTDAAFVTINFDAAIDENKFIAAAHYKPHDL